MTTGELVKTILKFFKEHPEAEPRFGTYGHRHTDNIQCCGLGAGYLAYCGIDKSLAAPFWSLSGSEVINYFTLRGIDKLWLHGFVNGFDGYEHTRDDPQFRKGYLAGKSVAKKVFSS